jgi:hypothetical protein
VISLASKLGCGTIVTIVMPATRVGVTKLPARLI